MEEQTRLIYRDGKEIRVLKGTLLSSEDPNFLTILRKTKDGRSIRVSVSKSEIVRVETEEASE